MHRWTCHVCTPAMTASAETADAAERAARTHYLNEHYYPRDDVTAADRVRYFYSRRHLRLG